MKTIKFTVDSALLRELGERLVGRPHIALAELIKNSYDADATRVTLTFEKDLIRISDNGHGMDPKEFQAFWMRVGSPHKERQQTSRRLHRPLTGSKGIGRLSAQFLSSQISLVTISDHTPEKELFAEVNWEEAVETGSLTEAKARYEVREPTIKFPDGSSHGTVLELIGLHHLWSEEELRELAKEIWSLQPPFNLSGEALSPVQNFEIDLESSEASLTQVFREQMQAVLEIWHARIRGTMVKRGSGNSARRVIRLQLQFAGERETVTSYDVTDSHLHDVNFEIRVFHLLRRQPKGIRVETAREYLRAHGGVHVYDAGFHLPYYGHPENDWLRIEFDHAHRLSKSQLLPEDLHVEEAMNFLPTTSRLFGVVNVNTSEERANDNNDRDRLQIQVSRDRLVDNRAYRDLVSIVRWAIDYYASNEAKRALARVRLDDKEPDDRVTAVTQALAPYRNELPASVYRAVQSNVKALARAAVVERQRVSGHLGLLGALATAGMSALAYEHEVTKQLHLLSRLARRLDEADRDVEVADIAAELKEWVTRARSTRALFAPLLDAENRDKAAPYLARSVLADVRKQLKFFSPEVEVRTSGVPKELRLPPARYVEWIALFQNVMINATNAVQEVEDKRISVFFEADAKGWESLLIEDSGKGVDLAAADELFEPFVRSQTVSEERAALGLGGTGLGLTIVRMIARNIGCRVGFVRPRDGYRTAFKLSWRKAGVR